VKEPKGPRFPLTGRGRWWEELGREIEWALYDFTRWLERVNRRLSR
jgi:hypothetical protein